MMEWSEMHEAVKEAKQTIKVADMFKQQMANLFVGQLKTSGISDYTLCELKKELRDYNMVTGLWRGENP